MAQPVFKYLHKLKGHRVLIVGGSSGIGFCVSEAALEHGASIIIASSSVAKLDAAKSRLEAHANSLAIASSISVAVCDLSKPASLEENIIHLLESATGDGRLDHVVFTAGDARLPTSLDQVTVDSIHEVGTIRHTGVIILGKHLPKYMKSSSESSFTLTSGSSGWRPGPNWTVIAGFAGGIEAVGRGLAVALKPIRVNCVQAGFVKTELFSKLPKEHLGRLMTHAGKECLSGKVGFPEEVAEAYIYSMKDTFATGAVIESNGGRMVGDSKDDVKL